MAMRLFCCGLLLLFLIPSLGSAQGTWTWVWGGLNSTTVTSSGLGNFAPGNSPGQTYAASVWTDPNGKLWRYGGEGSAALWQYDPALNQWALMQGDPGGVPGPVYGTQGVPGPNVTPGNGEFGNPAWAGPDSTLWLYSLGFTDDLWRYDIPSGMWTWMKGSGGGSNTVLGTMGVPAPNNSPGMVNETDARWVDSNGNFWLFREFDGTLWRYQPATNMWTWIKGAPGGNPVYGTIGVPGPNNTPGMFSGCPAVGTLYSMWIDSQDQLWMLVNRLGATLDLELWRYSIPNNEWSCMRRDISQFGASQTWILSCVDNPTIFPVPRTEARTRWIDRCDRLWLFGAGDFCNLGSSAYNDLWRYDPLTNNWTWVRGGTAGGIFGTQGVPSPNNEPNPAYGGQSWTTEEGFWLMGGGNPMGAPTHHLWLYEPDHPVADFNWSGSCLNVQFNDQSSAGCDSIYQHFWDFGDPGSGSANFDSVPDPLHQFSAPGTFVVTLIVENCAGIRDTTTETIVINCGLFLQMAGDSICVGECTTLEAVPFSGTSPYTYQWDNGITNTNAGPVQVCPVVTTTYSVTVTDAVGDSAVTFATVEVLPPPSVFLGNDTSLCGSSLLLDALNLGADFLWQDGSTGQTLNATTSGLYWVEVDNGFCSVRDSIVVTLNPSPVANFPPPNGCEGDLLSFQDQSTSSGSMITNWFWDFGDGNTGSGNTTSHSYATAGTYQVELIVVNGAGCQDTVVETVVVSPLPVADFSFTYACQNDTSHFTSMASGNIVAWQWDFGDGNGASGQDPAHVYLSPGSYSVTLTVISDQGCVDSVTQVVVIPPEPLAPLPVDDTVCQGQSAVLLAMDQQSDTDLYWYAAPDDAQPIHIGSDFTTDPLQSGVTYYVAAVSPDGCHSPLVPVAGTPVPPPSVDVLISSFEVDLPEAEVQFTTSNASSGGLTYTWEFGDGSSSSEANPSHTYTEIGEYSPTLTLTDSYGCEMVYTFGPIRVNQIYRLFVPSAFTPNEDGLNDAFAVPTINIIDLQVEIYDRWGRLMFFSEEVDFRWEGRERDGKPVPEGVYVYKIVALAVDQTEVTRNGTVTVYR